MRRCFNVLHRRVQLNRFLDRRETVLSSKVLYHWNLYCKLQKIRSRYEADDGIENDKSEDNRSKNDNISVSEAEETKN